MTRPLRTALAAPTAVLALVLAGCGGGTTTVDTTRTAVEPTRAESSSVQTPGPEVTRAVDDLIDADQLAEQISSAVAATGPVSFSFLVDGDTQSFSGVLDATGDLDGVLVDLGDSGEMLVMADLAYVRDVTGAWTRIEVSEDVTTSEEDVAAALMVALGQMAHMAATSFRLLEKPEISQARVSEASAEGVTYVAEHSDAEGDVELLVSLDPAGLPVGSRLRIADAASGATNELIVSYGTWGSAEPVVAPDPAGG